MNKVTSRSEVKDHLSKPALSPIGFVPTMGALHAGHISLVSEAVKQCPVTVVSIFVNPNQFNDKNDLKNYPRTEDKDIELLKTVMREDDLVFIPPVNEIYPEEDKRVFSFGSLENVMEGLHRPGHFNGVAQVVSRLFDIVRPDIAFFGQKDFQQLAIIKELVRQTGSKVRIVGCPIVREKDGLAMSSRNQLLEPAIREKAGIIYSTISKAAEMIQANDIPAIKEYVVKTINDTVGFNTEYFEIVDEAQLIPVNSLKELVPGKKYYGCIALKAGSIRLIDNIEITLR
jgi:pantoate--beta-alanine ligase